MKTKCIFSIMLIVMMALSTPALADDLTDIEAISVSLTNQDPDPAIAGDIAEVRIGIENKGGTISENVVLELVPQYPFELASGQNAIQNIGTIRGYQDGDDIKIAKYMIKTDKDAVAGSYELKLWKYKEGQRNIAKTEVILSIDVKNKESAEIIYIDKVELLPGKQTAMTFTINNVGSAPLRNLKFSWENEDDVILPVGSDDTRYIKYLDIGKSTELAYEVIASANAEPDLYKLLLSLTYDDTATGEETEVITSAGVYVGGETDFDITFSGSSMGETSFSIANTGSISASSVTISIPNQKGWKVSGINSVIIGNLNKGDYTVAGFNLQQTRIASPKPSEENRQLKKSEDFIQTRSSPALNSLPLNIEIRYTDTRGERHTISKEINIDSSSIAPVFGENGQVSFAGKTGRKGTTITTKDKTSTTKYIGIGIIILLIVIFANKKYRKERLKDPGYTYKKMVHDVFGKNKK